MSWLLELKARIRALFRGGAMDQERAEEMQYHLEEAVRRNLDRGMPADEARRQALLSFGGIENVKEMCRDERGTRLIQDLMQDLRFGLRQMRRNPGFTAVAVLTLALGIGANAAIFSFVDGTMLKPPPYREPDRLVNILDDGGPIMGSIPNLTFWLREATAFSEMALQSFPYSTNLSVATIEYPQPVLISRVSANYFEFLGIHAVLGRTFIPEDSKPDQNPVLVVSNRLWRTALGADPEIYGKAIYLNGKKHLVLGVLPPGLFDRKVIDLWYPLPAAPKIMGFGNLLGRLKPGVTTGQAAMQMTRIFTSQSRKKDQTRTASVVALGDAVLPRETRTILLLLLGAVGFVLLIACGNLANLLLARAAARQREIAIRLSVGAGRWRLVRQFLSESVLLSVVGGTFGTILAVWLVRILNANVPAGFLPAEVAAAVDLRILLFAFALSMFTGVLFGLAPALQFGSSRSAHGIPEPFRHLSSMSRRGGHRIQKIVLISEVVLSLVLVAGAALMVNSLMRMLANDLGFNASGLLTGRLSFNEKVFPTASQKQAGMEELAARLRGLPGVRSVGLANAAPFSEGLFDAPLNVNNRQRMRAGAMIYMVNPQYFETMGMRLSRGRWLSVGDGASAPGAIVVDRAFARCNFGDAEPLGQIVTSPVLGDVQWHVVGVADPVIVTMKDTRNRMGVYVPLAQVPPKLLAIHVRAVSFVVRVGGDPSKLAPAIRSIAASLDKNEPVRNLETIQEAIDKREFQQPRFRTIVLAAFGCLALLLAAVGIYGVFHYWVQRRTQEIGIRLALGAQEKDVVFLILRQGLRLVIPAILIGLAGAAALARLLRSMLFDVKPYDPATFVIAVLFVLGAAALACYIPARRASQIDPMEALRLE